MAVLKLTKSTIDKLPYPAVGQVLYLDSEQPGFGIRVGTQSKAYFAEGRVNGKTVRHTIGKHGKYTPVQAREEARSSLRMMAEGRNPVDVKRRAKVKGVTLSQAFADFLQRPRNLKPRTVYDYKRCMEVAFRDWHDMALLEISKDMVQRRHKKLGENNGEAYANLCMRFLRALLNFAAGQYEDSAGRSLLPENPVKRLTGSWYRVAPRQTVIQPHDLPAWYAAVMNLKDDYASTKREVIRDYLLLILFTGLRRQEAAKLTRKNVDFKAKTLTVLDTKNHQDHKLPLSDFLFDLLLRRAAETANEYLFPGEGSGGYVVEPRKQMARVTKDSGVAFTVHDLRRTFTTIAESLDIPAYALKRLINHKDGSDVTAGYIVPNAERLREPMQKITDYILKCAGVRASADVLPIKQKA